MPTSPFNPDPATSDAILQSIAANYSLSLTDIAAQHNTTIEALTAWLTREDIDERLTAIESACARRARLTAANHLPAVAHVTKQALEEASDVLRLPPDYRTHHSIALRIRATESARRAAALLLRIANFTPGPRRVRHHAAPTTSRVTPPPAPAAAAPTESAQSAPIPAAPNASMLSAATPTASAPCAPPFAPVSLPPTEITPAAPHTECAPAAPAAAPRTETAPSAPTSATTAAASTDAAQSAPTSLPPAESTPSDPISTTSPACTTPAPHAAPPNPTPKSPAIPAWFTLVPSSAFPAPNHSPAPNAHPPPRTPSRSLSPSASS